MNIPPSTLGVNGVDLLMAIIIALVIYIRRGDGIVAELFKLIGVFFTILITLHYYVRFAGFLRAQFFGEEVKAEFFSFCLLSIPIFLTFTFFSNSWSLILRIKSFEVVDRWGNLILSLLRSYFICSMVFLALLITGSDYFVSRAKRSMSSAVFRNAAVEFYKVSYSNLIEKFFPGEQINEKVFRVIGKRSGKARYYIHQLK